MRPRRGVLFDEAEQLVHHHRHHADHQQAGEGQAHLHRRTGGNQQVADAFVRGRHLRHRGADEGERDRYLERAPEVGHRARQADLGQHVPALGAEHAQHVFQLRLQRGEAGGNVDGDGEERDQESGEHRRPDANAEPHHQDGHKGGLGQRVEGRHQRVHGSFFSEATNMGMVSIVTRGDLLRKLNFSKEIIVLSAVLGAAINFSINLVVVLIFSLFNGVEFSWTVIMMLPLFIELFMMATGVAFVLSTVFVRFRDLAQIWEVIMQAGMYVTPIIYSLSFVMDQSVIAAKLIMLNPMAQIIQDMRYFIIDRANMPVWQVINNKAIVLIPYLIPILIFVVGVRVFSKHSKKFAEIL